MKKYSIEFEEKNGRFYSDIIGQDLFVKKIVSVKEDQPRFITATGFSNSGGIFFIYYHFEITKKIYTFRTKLKEMHAESISKYFTGASWIERELAELYNVEFSGGKKDPLFRLS